MEHSKLLSAAKLLLEINTPTLDDCWKDGYDMSVAMSLEDNPYTEGTSNHHHWSEGWWEGFYTKDDVCHNDTLYSDKKISNDDVVFNTSKTVQNAYCF